ADDDGGAPAVRRHDHRLHTGRDPARGAGPRRDPRRALRRVPAPRSDARAASPRDGAEGHHGGADRRGVTMTVRSCLVEPEGGDMEPFFRETGTGPGVVCIHANASTSGQWRGLMDVLAPRFRVFALDSYDSGKSPRWPSDRVIHLRDEVSFIEPVLT